MVEGSGLRLMYVMWIKMVGGSGLRWMGVLVEDGLTFCGIS